MVMRVTCLLIVCWLMSGCAAGIDRSASNLRVLGMGNAVRLMSPPPHNIHPRTQIHMVQHGLPEEIELLHYAPYQTHRGGLARYLGFHIHVQPGSPDAPAPSAGWGWYHQLKNLSAMFMLSIWF